MKPLVNLWVACILSATFALCVPMRTESMAAPPENDLSLGLSLFKEIAGKSAGGNVVISPSSAYAILAMVANGAGGETQKQLLNALGNKASLASLNKELEGVRQASKTSK